MGAASTRDEDVSAGEGETARQIDLANTGKVEDGELVAKWRHGRDQDAFAELFERQRSWLEPLLYGLLSGDMELVADARQDILVALVTGIDRYDGRAKFSTFCYRLARNVAVACLRKEGRRRRRERRAGALLAPLAPAAAVHDAEAELLEDCDRQRVAKALSGLAERDRAILLLRANGDLSIAGIASLMGIRETAARTRLHRARERLRAAWEDSVDSKA